jgi:hypothetical protein
MSAGQQPLGRWQGGGADTCNTHTHTEQQDLADPVGSWGPGTAGAVQHIVRGSVRLQDGSNDAAADKAAWTLLYGALLCEFAGVGCCLT